MQTNDLNRLVSEYGNLEDLKNLMISPIGRGYGKTELSKEMVLKAKEAINPEFLKKVRADVEKFQLLGKSRRWIRRWVKRKYNITEY